MRIHPQPIVNYVLCNWALIIFTYLIRVNIVLTGNFTQIVWRNTKYFGIGRARSRAGKMLIVANYQPAGNINGLFQENVLPPLANRDFL